MINSVKKAEKSKIWDPIDEDVRPALFERDLNELNKKYNAYKKHPNSIRFKLFLCFIPVFLLVGISVFFLGPFLRILAELDNAAGVVVLPFVFVIWYIRKIFLVQRDIVKLMIAKANNWTYSPAEKPSRWRLFKRKYPEIFYKGNQDQNMQDEFWGDFDSGTQKVSFYAGVFAYVTKTKDSKGRSSKKTYYNTIVAIKLNKKLKSDFRLEPEGLGRKFLNFFGSKEIEMESAEFNDKFAFFYNGKRADKELDIVGTLSPSVQVRILQMAREQKPFTLQFKDDIALFAFKGRMMKKMKTNFFRKVEIDQRDIDELNKWLNNMLNIASDIVPFLD